ncbi:MAG: hypothetical protein HKM93_19465 [Desulfobacteraceae bacterium]|nr:hypothetical protein [Desulfobacteraceae bacterium]
MKSMMMSGAVLLMLVVSCAFSTHPLSDAEKALFDHRLKGLWMAEADGEVIYIHIGVGENNITQIVTVEHDDKGSLDVDHYAMHPTVIDGEYYSNLLELDNNGQPFRSDKGRYIFIKYAVIGGDRLSFSIVNHGYVDKAVAAGELKGRFVKEPVGDESAAEGGDPLIMTTRYTEIMDQPENIIQWIRAQDPEVLFEENWTFIKKSLD